MDPGPWLGRTDQPAEKSRLTMLVKTLPTKTTGLGRLRGQRALVLFDGENISY